MLKDSTNQEISTLSSLGYLFDGLKLAISPQCRLFVIIPIIINSIVLFLGGYFVFQAIYSMLQSYLDMLPEWLSFLSYLVWFLLMTTIGFAFCYVFSTIATIIASPFYGLLAERAEKVIRNVDSVTPDEGLDAIVKDIPRILKRELQKMGFYLPRLIACIIVTCIPGINLVAPICWFLLAAWMMSIQYVDYAYDNHKISFAQMRHDLAQQRLATFSMGAIISLAMTIPFLNLFIPPAAVCAGTKYYVEIQRHFTIDSVVR